MALLYACSMDHYGTGLGPADGAVAGSWPMDATDIVGDLWASNPYMGATTNAFTRGSYDIKAPSWGARGGTYALIADSATVKGYIGGTPYTMQGTECMRLPIPGASAANRLIGFAFSLSGLPQADLVQGHICHLMNSSGQPIFTLAVSPSGRLQILDFPGTVIHNGTPYQATPLPTALLVSASSVIQAETWYFINMEITKTAGPPDTYAIDVYLGDITAANHVLTTAALSGSANGNVDMLGFLPASAEGYGDIFSDSIQRAVRDIVYMDSSGTEANALLGQAFVSAQEMRSKAAGGWGVNPRQVISAGILDAHTNHTALRCADAAALEIGASDFTVETEARFASLPTGTDTAVLVAKWADDTNNRGYRLYWNAADGTIRWEISTDGSAAGVVTVKALPWQPDLDKTYHVAVSRSGGNTRLFIDGKQLGVATADANTVFNSSASLGITGRFNAVSTLVTTSTFDGWLDETRITIGVGRYLANFAAPTTTFGRSVASDPSYGSVVLLLGYDGVIVDESSAPRTVLTAAPALTAILPDDAAHDYDVLNQRPAWDDTFVEAPNTFATGTLTFTGLPAAGETITVGATTYTWASPVGAANTVLIGATTADCIDNLVAAINAGAGAGTAYGTGTTANTDAGASVYLDPQMSLTAVNIGSGGNTVATTSTTANAAFDDATLTGGQDIPADDDFTLQRLPIDTTGIVAVQVSARVYKTDAGSSSLQFDLVGPGGGVSAGSAAAPDLNAAWVRQIFDTDPDTAAGLTPSTIIGGKIRFKRVS